VNPWDRDALRELRVAIAQRDLDAIGRLCACRELDEVLQLVGDALLDAPDSPLARECAERLRRRDLEGDTELADALDGIPNDLRPLAVDLEELASILEGDPIRGGGRIDLATGEIWHSSLYDDEGDEDDDDSDRWYWVTASSHEGWNDMADFIATVADPRLADRLERAIHGRGAFHRFRAELDHHPDELTRFHQFSDERQCGRARRWLAEHGVRPSGSPWWL
jgi:hypothetical protein